jgi:hypothetical protein
MRAPYLKGNIICLLVLPLVLLLLCTSPLHAKMWAAQFPYGSKLSPVFHAPSRDEVLIEAVQFCKQNKLCSSKYADADIKSALAVGVVGTSNLFVTSQCKKTSGEYIYVTVTSLLDDAAGREDGLEKGREFLQQENCLIHAVYGIKSGKRLKADLAIQEQEPISERISGEIRLFKMQRRNSIWTARETLD